MSMELRRRGMMIEIPPEPDNRIWLIKNGIEQTVNTGGYEAKAERLYLSGMSGWTFKAPTIEQHNGYLTLALSNNGAAVGSLIPAAMLSFNAIKGKSLYIDAESVLNGNGAYWILLMRGSDGSNYGNAVQKYGTVARAVFSSYINPNWGGAPANFKFPIQISTRSNSYLNIYNLWIE